MINLQRCIHALGDQFDHRLNQAVVLHQYGHDDEIDLDGYQLQNCLQNWKLDMKYELNLLDFIVKYDPLKGTYVEHTKKMKDIFNNFTTSNMSNDKPVYKDLVISLSDFTFIVKYLLTYSDEVFQVRILMNFDAGKSVSIFETRNLEGATEFSNKINFDNEPIKVKFDNGTYGLINLMNLYKNIFGTGIKLRIKEKNQVVDLGDYFDNLHVNNVQYDQWKKHESPKFLQKYEEEVSKPHKDTAIKSAKLLRDLAKELSESASK